MSVKTNRSCKTIIKYDDHDEEQIKTIKNKNKKRTWFIFQIHFIYYYILYFLKFFILKNI